MTTNVITLADHRPAAALLSPLNLALKAWAAGQVARALDDATSATLAVKRAQAYEALLMARLNGAAPARVEVLDRAHAKAKLAEAVGVAQSMTGRLNGYGQHELDRVLGTLSPKEVVRAVSLLPADAVGHLGSVRAAKRTLRNRKAA